MVIPPPVKSRALLAVSFEAIPHVGARMFGLPWKLMDPVNAKAQGGFTNPLTWATATAPGLTVLIPSTPAKYVGSVWATAAST